MGRNRRYESQGASDQTDGLKNACITRRIRYLIGTSLGVNPANYSG